MVFHGPTAGTECALHLGVILVILSIKGNQKHFSIKAEPISHIKLHRKKCLRVKICPSLVLCWKKHLNEGLCCSTGDQENF